MARLAPSHRYLARVNTLSGGNIATIPNVGTAGGHMAPAVGTLAAPTANAGLGGQLCLSAAGTQYLQSSLAASAWRFLHDGTGCTLVHVYDTGDTSGARLMSCTLTSTTGHDFFVYVHGSAGIRWRNFNGGVGVFDAIHPTPDTGPTYAIGYFATSASPQRGTYQEQSSGATGTGTGQSVGDPQFTFRLLGGNGTFFDGAWAETFALTRAPTVADLANIRDYMALAYGL